MAKKKSTKKVKKKSGGKAGSNKSSVSRSKAAKSKKSSGVSFDEGLKGIDFPGKRPGKLKDGSYENLVHPPKKVVDRPLSGQSRCSPFGAGIFCMVSLVLFVFFVMSLFPSFAELVVGVRWWVWIVFSVLFGIVPMKRCFSSCRR